MQTDFYSFFSYSALLPFLYLSSLTLLILSPFLPSPHPHVSSSFLSSYQSPLSFFFLLFYLLRFISFLTITFIFHPFPSQVLVHQLCFPVIFIYSLFYLFFLDLILSFSFQPFRSSSFMLPFTSRLHPSSHP